MWSTATEPAVVIMNYMAASTSNADFTTMYNQIVSDNPGHAENGMAVNAIDGKPDVQMADAVVSHQRCSAARDPDQSGEPRTR